jgi:hypothetical protein
VHAAVQQIFYNNAAGLHTKSRFWWRLGVCPRNCRCNWLGPDGI